MRSTQVSSKTDRICGRDADDCFSVLIGLTLAVDEDFKILFVVLVFHRAFLSPISNKLLY
jgi:hypothetical protein